MKTRILLIVMLAILGLSGKATNVSGGIFSNTTWILVNSPYIVTDTVVVFPGVTLTIEAGVVVKFDTNQYLEIRQAQLIAIGTAFDSITFTSNVITSNNSFYPGIYLNGGSMITQINYCSFSNANKAVYTSGFSYTLNIKNSTFQNNYYGLWFPSTLNVINIDSCNFYNHGWGGILGYGHLTIDHCEFSNNLQGAVLEGDAVMKNCIVDSNNYGILSVHGDTIINNQIKYNGTGIYLQNGGFPLAYVFQNIIEYNSTGIETFNSNNIIICNRICGNTSLGVYYNVPNNNSSIQNNYWCTTDSTTIASYIYDGYDNINLGLLSFMPIDTNQCSPQIVTLTNEKIIEKNSLLLYPNPFSTQTILTIQGTYHNPTLLIYNLLGQEVRSIPIGTSKQVTIPRGNLPAGMYFYKLIEDTKEVIGIGKLLVE